MRRMICTATQKLRGGLRMALVLLCSILLGFVLIMAAYMIPQEAVFNNLLESAKLFDDSDGTMKEEMNETLIEGYPSTWMDNTSDSVMLQHAAYDGPESLVKKALLNLCYEANAAPGDELVQYLTEGSEAMEPVALSRYWHGYLVVLKPLLSVMTYQDIRMVNMIIQYGLLMTIFSLMYRRGIQRYLPAMGAALLTLTPFVLPLNMHYSVVYLLALLSMLLMLSCSQWIEKKLGSSMLFMVTGIATSYFDILSNPLLSFGLPAVLWLLISEGEGGKKSMCTLVRIGISWLFGYVGMWAGKWLLVAIAISPEEAAIALDTLAYRSSADEVGRMETVWRNVIVVWRKPMKLLALAALGYIAVLLARRAKRGERLLAPIQPMLAVAMAGLMCLPFAWYFLIPNFNHIHYFFAHRTLAIAVFAGACTVTKLLTDDSQKALEEKQIAR